MDDFSALKDTEHMLRWLADEPYTAIRSSIAGGLERQVAGSQLKVFRVTSAPQWLTGVRPSKEGDSKSILVRAGVAFDSLSPLNAMEHRMSFLARIHGLRFSLISRGEHKQQVWMDLGGDLATFGSKGELMSRVYFDRDGAG